ncbi:endothelin-converting enzyme 2-like isoform X2 [Bacillus rossius redtenbacheri]|uniref:endothelin-converting enzyme 2-like isoform X2 n=1 Tax=Bacillus rossius redtenbacheri TaxID=93214 RepID=UPI002FDCDAF3
MAAKGEYTVQPPSPPAKDHSMRMCVMTLLVFFFICIVLLLIPLLLKNHSQSKGADDVTASQLDGTVNNHPTVPPVTEEPHKTATSRITHILKTFTMPAKLSTLISTSAETEPRMISLQTQPTVKNFGPALQTVSVAITYSATNSQITLHSSPTIAGPTVPLHVLLQTQAKSTYLSSSKKTPSLEHIPTTPSSTPNLLSTSVVNDQTLPKDVLSQTHADTKDNSSFSLTASVVYTSTTPSRPTISKNPTSTAQTTLQGTFSKTQTAEMSSYEQTPSVAVKPSTSKSPSLNSSFTMTDHTTSQGTPSQTKETELSSYKQSPPITFTPPKHSSPQVIHSSSTMTGLTMPQNISSKPHENANDSNLVKQLSTVAHASPTPSSSTTLSTPSAVTVPIVAHKIGSHKKENITDSSSTSQTPYAANSSSTPSSPTTLSTPSAVTVPIVAHKIGSHKKENTTDSSSTSQTPFAAKSSSTPSTLLTQNTSFTTTSQTKLQGMFSQTQATTFSSSPSGIVSSPSSTLGEVCGSGECKNLASRLLVLMNHAAEKCDDYYEYACGGLRENERLLEDDLEALAMDRITEQLHQLENGVTNDTKETYPFYKYYLSCINYYEDFNEKKRLEKAKSFMDSITRFYRHEEWKTTDSKVLTEIIYNLTTHHSTPLFDVLLDVDTADTSRFGLKLTAAAAPLVFASLEARCSPAAASDSDLLDLRRVYAEHRRCLEEQQKYYYDEVTEAVTELGVETAQVEELVNDTRKIRTLWSKHMVSPTVSQYEQLSRKFEIKTVNELKAEISLIDWELLFSLLLNSTIDGNTRVQVYFYENLKNFFTSEPDMSVALHNALVGSLARDIHASLVRPAGAPQDRGGHCLRLAGSLLEEFSSALYLLSFPEQQLQDLAAELRELFLLLRATLRERAGASTVLGDASKAAVARKLDAMRLVVPEARTSPDFLRRRLEGVGVVIDEKDFFNNTIALLKRYRSLLYSEYDKNPSEFEQIWTHFVLPYQSEGVSIYGLNTVVVPLGMMAEPFYHASYPAHRLLAGVGVVLAHEISHHFDCTGVKYDEHGRYDAENPLISVDEFAIWNETYLVEPSVMWALPDGRNVTVMLDDDLRNLWLDELIADQSGLKLALETYRRLNLSESDQVLPWLGMDATELFFLSAAQVFCTKATILDSAVELFENEHLPSHARVNFFISNSYDFEDKTCSRGTKMNPNFSVKAVPFPEEQKNEQ